ncbi:MAG: type II restriction enzyme [Fimbriimonadales bacterium]
MIQELFEQCARQGEWEFDNDRVKEVCRQVSFGNPFDATKIDSKTLLPELVIQQGYCLVHLGKGRHRFIPELKHWFHDFERTTEAEKWNWRYRSSLLNDIAAGESSTLSLAYNQRLLHDFLYEDITASPRIYLPTRTRTRMKYTVGKTTLNLEDVQMEIDLTLERQGIITVIEAKSQFLSDFAVHQIFHPLHYYSEKLRQLGRNALLNACYVLRKGQVVRLYLYEFDDLDRIDSIRLLRKAEYHLTQR